MRLYYERGQTKSSRADLKMESEQKSETKNESSIMDVPVGDSQALMLSTASQDDTNGSEENIENGGVSKMFD
jgi:hypothetical protein